MRRRLSVLVAATTSAVILAFLVPLALLLRTLATDRALAAATAQAQTVLVAASVADPQAVASAVATLVGEQTVGVITLYLADGTVLGPPVTDAAVERIRSGSQSLTRFGDGGAVVYVSSVGRGGTSVVRVSLSSEQLHRGVAQATLILAVLGALLLLTALFAADRLASRVSKPIRQVAEAAEAMRGGQLDTRVPEDGPPEVVALAGALNRLAARVEELLIAERASVADLSHRLRTPVTALRLDAEAVREPELAERLRNHVTQLERTVDAIVHDAKRPSRGDVERSCDVVKVVADRVAFWSALAEEQGRPLRLALPDRPLRARLDATELADVVDVLIDNVFAYTDEGVPLEVWVVARADGAVVLTIEDGGPGLPSPDMVARGRSSGGSSGLGLDIARRAAHATGGMLEVGRSQLGGALIRVVLGGAPPTGELLSRRSGDSRAAE